MMNPPLKGGKTVPRLLQDLSYYNPQRLPQNGFNILASLPPQFEEGRPAHKAVANGTCKHRWVTKIDQSSLPILDSEPDSSAIYFQAAYCSKCRCHLQLDIDFRGIGPEALPCPNEQYPLHHFLHKPHIGRSRGAYENGNTIDRWRYTEHFQCSSPLCAAQVTAKLESPRLKSEWVALLVDRSVIKNRAEAAIAKDPTRLEGIAIPRPIEVLSNLHSYIKNAMSTSETRKILGNNKKWLICLGDPCSDLLEYLGFSQMDVDWMPPRPDVDEAKPFASTMNILLDDVMKEILTLISEQPEEDRRAAKMHVESLSATPDMERVLGSKGFKKSIASRTTDLTQPEHPFYASLGATWDFHDDLIIYAYDRQTSVDSLNIPYYLECLQGIADGRKSEDLQTKAAIEASSGRISVRDFRKAYKTLGFDYPSSYLTDATIIGTFQARTTDAPSHEDTSRDALRIIGEHRSSVAIRDVASNEIRTYEQALDYLNATEAIDDSFLTSLYQLKVDENPLNKQLARNAISLIAEKRKSSALQAWLDTGHLGDVEMDVGHAYNCLGIDDRTLDDDMIVTTYNIAVADSPSRTDELKRALSAIAKSKGSQILSSFLNNGKVTSEHPLAEWPVGLDNIGNTCYLNSLLQFYFTVKPLRELVLNFDMYKESTGQRRGRKQVGSRSVSLKEIERAQRFIYGLQKLFQNMISAPSPQVTPEQELARLTLVSSSVEEHIRRQSILSAHRPSLGAIDGQQIQGPLNPKQHAALNNQSAISVNEETPTVNGSGAFQDSGNDTSSEATLVEAPLIDVDAAEKQDDGDYMMIDAVDQKQQGQILEDKENLPPRKAFDAQHPASEVQTSPLTETSSSRTNEQAQQIQTQPYGDRTEAMELTDETIDLTESPRHPPPVPPRQKPKENKKAIQEEVEIGAQQDVTEVIANVLFQLECAIRAEAVDVNGEQIDQVKNLFFGKQKSYTTNAQGVIRTKEEYISDIKVDVASGARDVYAALDAAFDVQEVEVGLNVEPQYSTISQLPPVLQILVQRAQFDPEKKTSFKSNHHLELKETIFMDRYMDSTDKELLAKRQECWKWKQDLAALQARKTQLTKTELGLSVPDILTSTVKYIQEVANLDPEDPIEMEPDVVADIESAAKDATEEIIGIDERMKTLTTNISSQFADLRTLPYRLHSVFIHRGMVSSGHYWIYIFDFLRNIWRKYNDGYVTEIKDVAEIYEHEDSSRPATPYFLVYVKDEIRANLVDAVCRQIIEQHEYGTQDTVMKDDSQGSAAFQEPSGPEEISNTPAPTGSWDSATQETGSVAW